MPYKPTHKQRHWYVMHNGLFCCLHLLFCWNYSLCIECLAKPTIEKQRHLILGARFRCNTNKFSSVNIRSSVNLICVVAQKKRLFYFVTSGFHCLSIWQSKIRCFKLSLKCWVTFFSFSMCQMENGTIYKYIHCIYIQEKKSFSDDSNNAIRIRIYSHNRCKIRIERFWLSSRNINWRVV